MSSRPATLPGTLAADVVGDLVDAEDDRRALVGHAPDAGLLEDQADLAADQAGDVAAVGQVLQVGLGA